MHRSQHILRKLPSLHGLFTVLALVGYVLSVIGYPVPSVEFEVAHTGGGAFPCQHHQCGCATAQQCWSSCCCFSRDEQVAWAKANHVALPEEFTLASLVAEHTAKRSCCDEHDEHEHGVACQHEHNVPTAADHSQADAAVAHAAPPTTIKWVHGLAARKCRGQSTDWIASGAVMPLPLGPAWEFEWLQIGLASDAPTSLAGVSFAPPVPPPWV